MSIIISELPIGLTELVVSEPTVMLGISAHHRDGWEDEIERAALNDEVNILALNSIHDRSYEGTLPAPILL